MVPCTECISFPPFTVRSESEFNERPGHLRGGRSREAESRVNSGGGLFSCDQPSWLSDHSCEFQVCAAGTSSWGNAQQKPLPLISESSRTLPPQLTHLFSALFFGRGGHPLQELSESEIICTRVAPAQGLQGLSEGPGRGREMVPFYPPWSGCGRPLLAMGRLPAAGLPP